MTQQSNFLTKAFQAVGVVLIAAIFFALGVWQLQRAADLKESLKVATTIDTTAVPLDSITAPRESIPAKALNKTVSNFGHYIANFKAPNQVDGKGKQSDWEVALTSGHKLRDLGCSRTMVRAITQSRHCAINDN
jgi:cytochrome oxidase assembly protein ShyY1